MSLQSSDPAIASQLGLLGIILSGLNVLVGLDCSPITVIGGSGCSGTTVTCTDNSKVSRIVQSERDARLADDDVLT